METPFAYPSTRKLTKRREGEREREREREREGRETDR